jgi:CubicO group peptidase (beta-lactamase class C family)
MALNEELNQLLTAKIDKEEFSGAVLVKQDDGTLFEGAYGYANRSWKVKNQVDTRFRIASISKMFTAAAILQLVDAGQLSLDASVLECLGLRNTRIPMEATVYHMLTMTSGIADWFDETGDWEANWAALCREHPIYLFRRNQDYLPLFVSEEPLAPVGEKHQYNGAGYILLGLIVEKLSGVSYFDYVRHNVFAKADMSRSDFLALDGIDDAVAEADGGATSTAADLVRFSQALRNEGRLSPELTQEMLTPKVLQTDERTRGYTWKYGYANAFLLDDDGQIVRWGHTGEEDGVSCRLYHYPEENLDVVILGNQSWCAGSLGWEIHDIVLELDPQ